MEEVALSPFFAEEDTSALENSFFDVQSLRLVLPSGQPPSGVLFFND